MNDIKRIIKKFSFISLLFVLLLTVTACGEEEEPPKGINTEYTDELKLTSDYANKSFLKDGIGLVTLSQNVDGDTAHFRDGNTTFTARFLMINTPESTGNIDPWGKAASKFVANILSNAKVLVCESEDLTQPAQKDTTNKRYLAYVWYKLSDDADFRLLNLEIVEECYSRFTDSKENSKYGESFQKAQEKCHTLGLRIQGEKDPDYNYSAKAVEISIAYLRSDFANYANGSKLKITARVVRIVGDNLYLEDVEQKYNDITGDFEVAGIYMFSGYGSGLGSIKIGSIISMNCQCSTSDIYGSQLTNPTKVTVTAPTGEYVLREYDGLQTIDLKSLEGLVIKVKNVKVTSVTTPNEEGAYTITVQTKANQTFRVRIDGDAYPKYPASNIEIGKEYDVTGGVSQYVSQYYPDDYQIMLGNICDDAVNDFILSSAK